MAKEQQPEKLSALTADFLLYIAEMEQIEQQWHDPISIEHAQLKRQSTIKADNVPIPNNNAMNVKHDSKQVKHQVKTLQNKGVK